MKNKIRISLFTVSVLLMASIGSFRMSAPDIINVFAGEDKTICVNQNLLITELNATITGDVSNGDWLTYGDGRFQPGNLLTVRYNTAIQNQITYVPGPNDKALGFYRLLLMSDAPQNNPQERVTDEVKVTFQTAPPLFCSNNINISLNETCTQKVIATMLQPNPVPPYSNYIISLYDAAGVLIPNNTLTRDHIDKEITFKLGHQCTSNICWGKFKVEDYFPPVFVCRNDTIPCTRSFSPDSLGFPFPTGAYIDTIINNKYIVKNWDACSDVTLEYTDVTVKAECVRDEDKTITRKWKATDAKGNSSTCNEMIVIKRIPLSSVYFPPHFDGNEKPFFECGTSFPVLANGHPSPDTTGRPGIGHCGNLQFNMTDVPFQLCGKSFKVARSWFVIDWCTSESVTKNQIIVVKDTHGPKLVCKDTITLYAGAYACASEKIKIPDLISAEDCSAFAITYDINAIGGWSANQFIEKTDSTYFFNALPVENYFLSYVVTDQCNNTTTCRSFVRVIDHIAPNTVCDKVTKVALDNQGKGRIFATTFDDGSTDNCGIAGFKVRKMDDTCGFGLAFGDYVDFCCAELGTTQMVALQVTDIHGNKNTCMVEVVVEDKLKPIISCPPNITIACTDNYDFEHLEVFGNVVTKASDVKDVVINNYYHSGKVGKDGLATDNCSVTVSHTYTTDIECHVGRITRKFVATDAFGLKDSCYQVITILNPYPFTEEDIRWPDFYESSGCKISQTGPDVTGKPTFINTACATVAATYEDNKFYIADGACIKIIRTWTVVDWCQYSGTNTIGKWSYTQLIKLHNTDAPEFTTICRDTVFCSYDANCTVGMVNISHTAKDPCTDDIDLIWKYTLDIYNDNVVDSIGSLSQFAGEIPLGHHKITWRVEDQCGNYNTCEQYFDIYDCKKPTPYCISSLTITLDQVIAANAIWAIDFDKDSYDNCTPKNELIFTFNEWLPVKSMIDTEHYFKDNGVLSDEATYKLGEAQIWIPATRTSGLYFDCDDIPDGKEATIPLTMSVMDTSGNIDFCEVELILQDNSNLCPDLITTATVSGRILTTNNKVPANTKIEYKRVEKSGEVDIVSTNGKYIMNDLELGFDYKITPMLNTDPLEGVTTLDLVLIQRHILGLTTFDSPYKILAADINSSKSLSASDLVELRKMILGINAQFPKGLPSWIFVDKKSGIQNPTFPYDYTNYTETGHLQQDVDSLDFVAVKIGDVNQSAFSLQNNLLENRNNDHQSITILLDIESHHGDLYLTMRSAEDITIDALQLYCLTPAINNIEYADTPNLFGLLADMEKDVYIHDVGFNMVMYSGEPVNYVANSVLGYLKLSEKIDLASINTDKLRKTVAYVDGQEVAVEFRIANNQTSAVASVSLVHNPVVNLLTLKFPWSEVSNQVNYRIVNAAGKEISASSLNYDPAISEYQIPLDANMLPGIYFISLRSEHIRQSLKFIKIQ